MSRAGRTARRRSPAVVVAALAAGVALLAGCGPETASADAVVAGRSGHLDGTSSSFVVPTGILTVTVGAPTDQIDGDDTADGDAWSAPDGSSLLPVLVDFDYRDGAPWGGRLAARPQPADVTVTVGGEERDLGSPYTADGTGLSGSSTASSWVVVPGDPDPEDVRITVAYDGADQSADAGGDPTGRAAALAELSTEAPGGADCPSSAWRSSDGPLRVACDLPLVGRTPYWPGSGWAPAAGQWAVVGADRLQVYPARSSEDEVRAVTGLGATEQFGHGEWGPTGLSGVIVVDSSTLRGGAIPLRLRVSLDRPTTGAGPVTASSRVAVPR